MIESILKNKLLSAVFCVSFGFIVGAIAWVYVATKDIAGSIVVHFNDISGITQIGNFLDILLIGITGAVIVVVNFFLALELESRDLFLGKIVAAATLFMSLLIFIAFATIISVN